MSRAVERPQRLPLMLFFVGRYVGGEDGCSSVPLLPHVLHCPLQRKKVKDDLRSFLLAITSKNKPLTVFLFLSQSRSSGSKLHCIPGEIHVQISPLDKVAITVI